ncbi:hypothetical protein PZ938_00120 [Luteipulveratus sp. YIM 133132]|nr:hypothetical protein [Luteipulveratus sp. YIM 133132]MDE9363999.1 hypothetical protein [Luteipulveratus sp. YIM 133132]
MLDATSQRLAAQLVTRPVSRAVNNVRTANPRDPSLITAAPGVSDRRL